MRNNASVPCYGINAAMYAYLMQCMMNGANRNYVMNGVMNQPLNGFALGFNQPYSMNPNNMSAYYKRPQQPMGGSTVPKRTPQPYQSQFSRELDYEFDMLNKKREREVTTQVFSKEESEDISKWLMQRRLNYPSKEHVSIKQREGEMKEEKGMISQLELKLRRKNQLLNRIDGRPNRLNHSAKSNNYPIKYNNHQNTTRRGFTNSTTKQHPTEELEEGEVQDEAQIAPHSPTSTHPNHINPKRQPKSVKPHPAPYFFKYKRNSLYEMMLKQEKIIEANILLQVFRYFQKEGLI